MCVNVFLLNQAIVEVRLSVGSQAVAHGRVLSGVSPKNRKAITQTFFYDVYIISVMAFVFVPGDALPILSLIHI